MAQSNDDYGIPDDEYEPLPPRRMADNNSKREGPFWDWYVEYLQSPQWKKRCAETMKRAKGRCALCKDSATDTDHLNYRRVGRERPEDLQALCLPCHEKKHGRSLRCE